MHGPLTAIEGWNPSGKLSTKRSLKKPWLLKMLRKWKKKRTKQTTRAPPEEKGRDTKKEGTKRRNHLSDNGNARPGENGGRNDMKKEGGRAKRRNHLSNNGNARPGESGGSNNDNSNGCSCGAIEMGDND
ncbi:hypothetical protein RUND412_000943 [Rhizina undulata]